MSSKYTLFCDLRETNREFRSRYAEFEAVIWHMGGCINGCHQPFMVVDEWRGEGKEVREEIRREYPDIEFRFLPRIVDGKLVESP